MPADAGVGKPPGAGARGSTAADVMTPGPRSCSPFCTVTEAALIFRDEDCGVVPVLEAGRPVGILTDRDVALAAADYPDLMSRTVSDLMTRDPVRAIFR